MLQLTILPLALDLILKIDSDSWVFIGFAENNIPELMMIIPGLYQTPGTIIKSL